MLEELHVSGLGVIREASLEFAPGLNVLTGETGAGKTMVTVALSLALGARAAPDLVRADSGVLSVEARFSLGPSGAQGGAGSRAGDLGAEVDDFAEDGELIVARSVRPEGRGSSRAGGHLVPASTLSRLGAGLLEIHGQRQADRLLEAGAQTEFLDRFAGARHLQALARYGEAHSALTSASRRLDGLERDAREREREKDLVAYQVSEIERAGLVAGESSALVEEEARLAHAERLLELTAATDFALAGDAGASDRMREAASALDQAAAFDLKLGQQAAHAASIVAEADELTAAIRSYREQVEVDRGRLQEVRERLLAIRALERKYGEGEEGILGFLAAARERLAALQGSEGEREALEAEVTRLRAEAEGLSLELSKGRAAAAPALAEAVSSNLQELGLPGGRIDVTLEPIGGLGPGGAELAEFVFSGGPGQPARPFAKAASGGELSRTMLACRTVLADLDDVQTLIFDEVDAGIGGRAAVAVGKRLAALAARRQVLVVTHLPQIAVHAARHFVVNKSGGTAEVRALGDRERPAELARMLAGSVDEASLAHARELLAGAKGVGIKTKPPTGRPA